MRIKSPRDYTCSFTPRPHHPRNIPTDKNAQSESATCPLDQIILHAADKMRTVVDQLRSLDRDIHTCFLRQVAMFLCCELTGASYPFIGKHFNRHYSTVIHAIRQVAQRIEREPAFRRFIDDIAGHFHKGYPAELVGEHVTNGGLFI
jgi:chromosomal replication initiation ATPase DnaA